MNRLRILTAAAVSVVLLSGAPLPAPAQSYFVLGGGTGMWQAVASWTNGAAAAGSNLIFNTKGFSTNNFAAGTGFGWIDFRTANTTNRPSTTASWIYATGFTNESGRTVAWTIPTTFSNTTVQPQIYNVGSSLLFLTTTVGLTNNSGQDLLVDGTGATTIAVPIAGAPGLTKSGAGTLTLSSGNTFTNGITLNAGTVSIDADNRLGAVPAAVAANVTFAGNSTLAAGASFGLQTNRSIQINNGVTATFDTGANNLTVTGAVVGTGGTLAKAGTGTLLLNGPNAYDGGTVINAGVVRFGTNALPTTGSVNIGPAGALMVGGAYGSVAAWLDSGYIPTSTTGALALTAADSSSTIDLSTAGGGLYTGLCLSSTGTVAYTGILTPAAGVYRLGGGGGTLNLTGNLTLNGTNSFVLGNNGSVYISGSNSYSGGTLVPSTTTKSLIVASNDALGTGTVSVFPLATANGLVLTNGVTLTNAMIFSDGAGSGNRAVQVPVNGGVCTLLGPVTLVDSGAVTTAGVRIDTNPGGTLNIAGTIGGSNGYGFVLNRNTAGTIIFSHANNDFKAVFTTMYSGLIQIGGDNAVSTNTTIQIQSQTAPTTFDLSGHAQTAQGLLSAGGFSMVVTNTAVGAATLTLAFPASSNFVYAGRITDAPGAGRGAIAVVVDGGTETFGGTNSYSGGTTIRRGMLQISNAVALPAGTGNVDVQYGATLASLAALDQPTLARAAAVSSGTVAMTVSTNLALDFSAAGVVSLGAIGTATNSGAIAPNGTTYRLGGGGGTLVLTNADALTVGHDLVVGGSGSAGTVVLASSNSHDGGTALIAGTLNLNAAGAAGTGAITLNAGTTLGNSSGVALAQPNSMIWNGGFTYTGNSLTFSSGTVTMNTDIVATVSGAGNLWINSPIGGSHSLARLGTGNLILGGTNTFDGGLTLGGTGATIFYINSSAAGGPAGTGVLTLNGGPVRAGGSFITLSNTVLLAADTTVPSGGATDYQLTFAGPTTISNGTRTLTLNTSNSVVFAGDMGESAAGSGLIKGGVGRLVLGGNNSFSGGLTITGGAVSVGADLNLGAAGGAVTVLGGTLQVTGTALNNLDTRPVNWGSFTGALDIADSANVFTVTNTLAGAGILTKLGAGRLVLAGTNTLARYLVSQGILELPAGGVLTTPSSTQPITVGGVSSDTATLFINGGAVNLVGTQMVIGDTATPTGRVIMAGGTYTSVGAIRLATYAANTWGAYNATNAIITLTDTGNSYLLVGRDGVGTFTQVGGTTTIARTQTGAGNGALMVGYFPGSTGTYVLDGGMLNVTNGGYGASAGINGTGTLIVTNGAVANFRNLAVGAAAGGTGAVYLASGELRFNGLTRSTNNAVVASVGNVFWGGGVLRPFNADATLSNGLPVTLTGAGTSFNTEDAFATARTMTIAGSIGESGGSFGATKNGAGTLVFTGTNTYSGGTVINAGTAQFNLPEAIAGSGANVLANYGTVAAAGYAIDAGFAARIAPASSGVVALAAASANPLDFSPAGAGLTNAGLGAVGAMTYSGTLTPFDGVTYRLGGGGGTLTMANPDALTAGHGLLAFGNGTGGTVMLMASNSYDGGTFITAGGIVQSSNSYALGTGPVTNNGTLQFRNNSTMTYAGGLISGTGVVDLNNSVVYLGGSNSYSGGTLLSGNTRAALGDNNALGPGPVTVINGSSALSSSGTQARALSNALVLSNNVTLGNSTDTGTLSLNGILDLGGAVRTLQISSPVVVNGAIVNGGLTKSGATYALTLAGPNTYAGGTTLSTGPLNLNSAGALGTGPFTIAGGSIDNTSGAPLTMANNNAQFWTGDFSFAGSTNLNLGAGTVALGANRTVTIAGNTLTVGAVTGAFSLVKAGPGTLAVAGASAYTGATTIEGGTLQVGAFNALPLGTTLRVGDSNGVGRLDMSAFSQTVAAFAMSTTNGAMTNTVTIGSGQTLTVSGAFTVGGWNLASSITYGVISGGGALVAGSGSGTMLVGNDGNAATTANAVLDLSGLGGFTANYATINIGAGGPTGRERGSLTLAATNTLTAATLVLSANNGNPTSPNNLFLGAVNTLNVNSILVGTNKCNTLMAFNSGLVDPTLRIRGQGGTDANRANLTIGDFIAQTVSGSQCTGVVDWTAGTVDAKLGTLLIGRGQPGTGVQPGGGTLSFAAGTVDANVVLLGVATATSGSGGVGIGTLNQSGGNLLVGSGGMLLGGQASTALGIGTFNLTGGTATLGGDLVSSNGVGTLNLAGGTLDLQGNDIGPAGLLVDNVNLQSGTLRNVGQFQNGAPLVKTGAGTLLLDGNNTYTGGTTVSNGILRLASAGGVPANSALRVEGGAFDAGAQALSVSTLNGAGGSISNGAGLAVNAGGSYGGSIAGGGPLAVNGGILLLSAANPYTGATVISNGTLQLGAAGSIGNSSAIRLATLTSTADVSAVSFHLAAGQQLSGIGTLQGGLIMDAGASLNPGNSPGTLNVSGDLTLATGTTNYFELVGPATSDLVLVGGTLNLGGIQFGDFAWIPDAGVGTNEQTYVLFHSSTGVAGSLGAVTNGLVGSSSAYLHVNGANDELQLTVIPEPGTVSTLGLFAIAALLRRRLRG